MREEWPALEAAAQHGELRLLWILVRACLWEHTPLARYQAALDPKQPLSAMSPSNQDAAIVEICRQIERAFRASSEGSARAGSSSGGTRRPTKSVQDLIQNGKQQRLAALTEEHAAALRQLAETDGAIQRCATRAPDREYRSGNEEACRMKGAGASAARREKQADRDRHPCSGSRGDQISLRPCYKLFQPLPLVLRHQPLDTQARASQ
jgi:hypothetical protein